MAKVHAGRLTPTVLLAAALGVVTLLLIFFFSKDLGNLGATPIVGFIVSLAPALLLTGVAVFTFDNKWGITASFGGGVAVFFFGYYMLQKAESDRLASAPRFAMYVLVYEETQSPVIVERVTVNQAFIGDGPSQWFLNDNHDTLVLLYPPNTSGVDVRLVTPHGDALCRLEYAEGAETRIEIGTGDKAKCKLVR